MTTEQNSSTYKVRAYDQDNPVDPRSGHDGGVDLESDSLEGLHLKVAALPFRAGSIDVRTPDGRLVGWVSSTEWRHA